MNEYISVLKKYWVFTGRATRKEYWTFFLVNLGVILLLAIVTGMDNNSLVSNLYALAIVVPSIAVAVRRLHDIGKSGNWFFINFIPFVGSIILLVMFLKDGQVGANPYGPDPKSPAPVAEVPAQ